MTGNLAARAAEESGLQRSLGRIEGKLDSLSFNLTAHTADDHHNFSMINRQVATIQRMTWMALGVIAFLSISIPVAISYFK